MRPTKALSELLANLINERSMHFNVHQYPGAVYKTSFVTADQAVQWLWSNVLCRVANQDLRAKQFLADTRLFPDSSAARVNLGASEAQLSRAYRRMIFKCLSKMKPAPFPESSPNAAAFFAGPDVVSASFPAEPMASWFGRNGSASSKQSTMFNCVAEWFPLDSCTLIAALGSSLEFDISNFSVPLGDISVAQISGLGSDLSVTSQQRLNSMYGSYVSTSAIGAQVTDDPIADLDGDSGVEPNSIVLSDLSVWVPSVAGMQVISVPRSQELSESIDPLSDFNDAVINSADSTGSPLVGAIQSLGRYHTLADSAGVFVESDANASAALLREPPDRYHIRFHMEKVNNPLPLFFIGDIGNPLRDVLGSVPRAINSDVLRLCMPGLPYGGSSFECFDTIVVECSRVVCFDLRDLFLTDKVRLYHQRSVSMPASAVGLSGSPLSVSPSSLEWMHASGLRDVGFAYVNDSASVSIVLASPD